MSSYSFYSCTQQLGYLYVWVLSSFHPGSESIGLVVDLVFLADVVVNFLTSFECENGHMQYRYAATEIRKELVCD